MRLSMHRPLVLILALILAVGLWEGAQGEQPPMSASPAQPLSVTLETDHDSYRPGQPIAFHITLRNTGDTPVDLFFATGRRFDISVSTPAGDDIWRWSMGAYFTQAIQQYPLAPGAEETFTATWDQRLYGGGQAAPGPYQAVATIVTGDRPESEPVHFTIR